MFRHLAGCFRDSPPSTAQCAVGVAPFGALPWGKGSALWWVFVLPGEGDWMALMKTLSRPWGFGAVVAAWGWAWGLAP